MPPAGIESIAGEEQTNLPSQEQNDPLLHTKLFIPPVRPNRVPRPRLFEQLQAGLDKALTLVIAPAGYGKTTLVSSWLQEAGIASTWLSLDEEDNDPNRFLQYFLSALHKVVPAIQIDMLGMLQGRQPAHYIALLNILLNELSASAAPFVLVLDDFHTLQSQPVLELLTYLFEHAPVQVHILLLSRADPPLPLSRMRVRNHLVELRADQLRFTRQEITQFLNDAMLLSVSPADIISLEARTEGWIAGLQLAAISMQGGKDVHGFVSAFTGSHHYIMDYLAEEVLRLQPETVRSFLLQASVLERMCGPLCDEVVNAGQAGRGNGQAMLEALEQMNMFIIPLDSERRWYRFHHLFADVLNRRLEQDHPQLIPDLHRRASAWHAQNGLIFDAIRHSLAAGELDRAAHLLDEHGCLLLMRGEVVNLLHWIEAIEPYSQTLPWIAIQKAWALCLAGQLDRAEAPLQTASRLISALAASDDTGTMSGALSAAQAYRLNMQGHTRQAAALARQALDQLPESSDLSCSLRSVATSILGDASWLEGDLAEARGAYASAVLIGQATGNSPMVIIAQSNLAEVLLEQGQLQQARRTFSETLPIAVLPDGRVSPLAARLYAGLGWISYEWNHLEEAARHVQQCIELSRGWGGYESQSIGLVVSARLELAQGQPARAVEAMRSAEQLMSAHAFTPWLLIGLKSDLARIWIAQGDLEKASQLLQHSRLPVDALPLQGEISHPLEPLYLVWLRLLLAQGLFDSALAVSAWLLQNLDATSRLGRVIEAMLLRSLAFQGKKDLDQALQALEMAFSLARPEGYMRIFLDEGAPMARLLYQARSRHAGAGYASELLAAMGEPSGRLLPPAQQLIPSLTSRELEVLKLIESGCSNQEIAAQLVISLPTVKRHISNIYTKLGTRSRTQALSRLKELNLL